MALIAAPSATANSYCTRAAAAAYFADLPAARKTAWTAATDDEKDAALIAATQALEARTWLGWKTHDLADNALRWPRSGLYNADGQELDADSVPAAIVGATAELANAIMAGEVGSGGGSVAGTTNAGIASVTVGSIRVSYSSSIEATSATYRSAFPNAVELLIAPFVGDRSMQAIRG